MKFIKKYYLYVFYIKTFSPKSKYVTTTKYVSITKKVSPNFLVMVLLYSNRALFIELHFEQF